MFITVKHLKTCRFSAAAFTPTSSRKVLSWNLRHFTRNTKFHKLFWRRTTCYLNKLFLCIITKFKHIVIGEPLSIGVVRFVIKTQRTAEIQVCGKFSCNTRKPYFSFSFTFAFYKSEP
uniref:Uncharacterized protein n=1 Tax=Anser brachyrhynchus TaxID=132585 RepID=A0A8B9BYN3_9AVES